MSKPREFWIWLSNGGLVADTEKRPFVEKEIGYLAHVIEKSAYQDLIKANDILRSTVLATADRADKLAEVGQKILDAFVAANVNGHELLNQLETALAEYRGHNFEDDNHEQM